MNNKFSYIFRTDYQKNVNGKNIVIFCIIVLLLLFILQKGIWNYKSNLKNVETFRLSEELKAKQFLNYTMYGAYGIRLLSSPNPLACFFPFQSMVAHVDTGSRLSINIDLKKNGILTDMKGFAGLLTLFILFVSMLLGVKSFENRELMHFYKRINGGVAYWAIGLSRFLLASGIMWLILFLGYILSIVNGIHSNIISLMSFGLILELGIFSFLCTGMLFDIFFHRKKIIGTILFYFLSLFFVPEQINEFVQLKNDSIQTELNNLKMLMTFESKYYNEVQILKEKGNSFPKKIIDLVEGGQLNEYMEMKKNEERLMKKIESYAKIKHLIHSFLPSTFILNCANELSGSNDKGLIIFFKYAQEIKDQFIRYYIQKKFYEKTRRGEIDVFPESQVFEAKPDYPYYLLLGIILTLFWNILLISINRYGFIHYLNRTKKTYNGLKIHLQRGILNYFLTKSLDLKASIFHMFTKNKNITVNGNKVDSNNFIYLPDPKYLPPNAECMFGINDAANSPTWKTLLEGAIDTGKIIICISLLRDKDDSDIKYIKDLLKQKDVVFIEIGEDEPQWKKSENPIWLAGDTSVKANDYCGCFKIN